MQCKNYTRPSCSKHHVHDIWRPRIHKTPIKPSGNYCMWSYVDQSPSKYWYRRPRSINPNFPIITCPEGQCQGRQRFVFKNRFCPSRKPQKIESVQSKKSIPNHALMKNLLSGLSIFEEDGPKPQLTASSVYRHKSMGNINGLCKKSYEVKPSAKSSVDFTEISLVNRNFNDDDFREYCRKYAKESLAKLRNDSVADRYTPENYFAPKSCTDSLCPYNCRRNIGEACFFKQYPKVLEEDSSICIQRRNIVQERRQFFEKKEKDMKEECRMNKCKSPSRLFVIPVQKENDRCRDCDSITELYRNAKTIASTTTISRSKHSRLKLTQPRHIELFHPDFNFDDKSSSSDFRQSIIDSIRTKIFHSPSSFAEEDDDFSVEGSKMPRFPRETRKAVSIIMNQKRLCRCRTKQVLNVETQTSPISSKHSFHGASCGLPCTKNLLCRKGYHSGRCEEEITRKLESMCRENCLCKRDQSSTDALRSSFWPSKTKRHLATQQNLVKEEPYDESTYVDYSYGDYDSRNENDDKRYMERSHYGNGMKTTFLRSIEQDGDIRDRQLEIYRERASYVSPPTMNGLNGHSNGELNGCGDIITQNQQRGCWTIGLINSKYRYLTAETFGFKINANGTSLKKKQIWTLEPDLSSGGETCIYLKSHLDKYLAVDSFGNVTCESEEKEPGCKFQISVSEDGKGRWAFRNAVRGYFLGSSSDKLTCTAKVPTDAEFWHIHLAARPQVNLRSVGRKRFAHLSENLDEIHVDANIPWGEDTLFTLEFHADEDGKYALHTCNNKYLSNGGKLVDKCTEDCLFSAEYHSGQLALRDRNGQYLSPIGSKAVLKTRSNTVTKDELFSLEDSLPQASFVAALNARYVSVKQGVDVTANQDEISDHETFQLEFDWSTKRWYIRTMQDKYWTLETGGGIQASGDKRSSNALFDLVWQNDGSLAFRANNGRYVITKRSGHLYATSDVIEDTCKYFFYLINRPILVLKCEQGFVGYKSAGNPKLECNKATYECIQVERAEKGVIHFKGQNGKYWHVDSESVTADSDAPENFYLELREPTRLCIKTANGNYLTASKNGIFRLGDTSIENATQWEY